MKTILATAAMALLSVVPGSGAIIHFVSVDGVWQNATPVDPLIIVNNALDPREVEWGNTNGLPEKSKYLFSPFTPPDINIPPSPSPTFKLGDFTHENFLVDPTFLSTVELNLTVHYTVDGVPSGAQNFVYLFTHDETPNGLNPCPYDAGIPPNGCSDRVTVSSPTPSVVNIGGVDYNLDLKFLVLGVPTNQLITLEQASNAAIIQGQFTATIPEPATFVLMGTALGAVVLARRRRKGNA